MRRSRSCWPRCKHPLHLERGHRTLTVLRKGGKVVTIPLAPRTARATLRHAFITAALDAGVPLRDVQESGESRRSADDHAL